MKIFIKTYGCTYNFADSQAMRASLEQMEHTIARNEEQADVVVLNTCAVKQATESKILWKTKQLGGSGKKLVVTGCLAQTSPKLVQQANAQASVVGTYAESRIVEAVEAAAQGNKFFDVSRRPLLSLQVFSEGVIAPVRISQGCASACTFCQTKLARGYVKSFPPREVREAVAKALNAGAKELQLTSQDTGCYGYDLGAGVRLPDLLEEICALQKDFRLRVGMLNPQHALALGEKLLKAFESEKIYKFLHVPVQSGSDEVLKAMKRGYSVQEFKQAVKMFRQMFPEITVETDIIVGFPTETQEDFHQTLELLKEIRFDVVNLSRFSPRLGTPAAKMPQLPTQEIKRRSEEASKVARRMSAEKLAECIGKEYYALVTEKTHNAFSARTFNYKPVLAQGLELGQWARVRIVESGLAHLKGEVID